MNALIILLAKFLSWFSQTFNFGNGSTWPGHIILKIRPSLLTTWKKQCKNIIFVAGTNGKTTTAKMIRTVLDNKCVYNDSGANLLNGLVSAFLINSDLKGKLKYDTAVFEVDENTLSLAIKTLSPNVILCLNLFRDQLDRYGEVEAIAHKWKQSFQKLPSDTKIIVNADDPLTVNSTKNTAAKVYYFGIEQEKSSTEAKNYLSDINYCPVCGQKLHYEQVYYSHLGKWSCKHCKTQRPPLDFDDKSTSIRPLAGIHNLYNIIGAFSVSRVLDINNKDFENKLKSFQPGFGRTEELLIDNKKVSLLLAKNPASMNVNLQLLQEKSDIGSLVFVLNDRIPDGHDISWIWDTDLENLKPYPVFVSGDRAYDMAVRLKYAGVKFQISNSLKDAIYVAIKNLKNEKTLYILANYSAMLEVRKILTGRRIL